MFVRFFVCFFVVIGVSSMIISVVTVEAAAAAASRGQHHCIWYYWCLSHKRPFCRIRIAGVQYVSCFFHRYSGQITMCVIILSVPTLLPRVSPRHFAGPQIRFKPVCECQLRAHETRSGTIRLSVPRSLNGLFHRRYGHIQSAESYAWWLDCLKTQILFACRLKVLSRGSLH